jgi:predicted metal-binding membrane protein
MADSASFGTGFGREIDHAFSTRVGSETAFLGVAALLFAVSVTGTVLWCGSMTAMAGVPMPGGWTMSMAWLPICGQTWLGSAASFSGMWMVMMAAMMLPSLVPMLRRYRQAVGGSGRVRTGSLTVLVGAGYFAVWAALGMAVFPLGAALAAAAMQEPALARAFPLAEGAVVLFAGVLQFTAWKARRLACCHDMPRPCHLAPASPGPALRHGLGLGIHCIACCANLTVILLVVGVMDLGVMVLVTAAITAERLLPAGESVARVIGAVLAATGLLLITRAAGLG